MLVGWVGGGWEVHMRWEQGCQGGVKQKQFLNFALYFAIEKAQRDRNHNRKDGNREKKVWEAGSSDPPPPPPPPPHVTITGQTCSINY